jgi:hypothetical protein
MIMASADDGEPGRRAGDTCRASSTSPPTGRAGDLGGAYSSQRHPAWATLDRSGESEGGRSAGSMIDLSTRDLGPRHIEAVPTVANSAPSTFKQTVESA